MNTNDQSNSVQSNIEQRTRRIRELNDEFRTTLTGGSVLFTAGILALGAGLEATILDAIRTFDAFGPGNDPYGEHDFGCVDIGDHKVFFKIDYYHLTRAAHADDPSDPDKTERVMTIMLASEY